MSAGDAMRESFAALKRTFRRVRKFRAVWFFLLPYWLYIDGVNTIHEDVRGLRARSRVSQLDSLIAGILMVQFIGFPAALLFGWIGDRISPLVGIFIWHRDLRRRDVLCDVLMTDIDGVLRDGGCDRLCARRHSSHESLVLWPSHSGRSARRVLRFLQHDGQIRRCARPFLMGVTARSRAIRALPSCHVALLFLGGAIFLAMTPRAHELQARKMLSQVARPGLAVAVASC